MKCNQKWKTYRNSENIRKYSHIVVFITDILKTYRREGSGDEIMDFYDRVKNVFIPNYHIHAYLKKKHFFHTRHE